MSWTSFERLTYVQFMFCVQWADSLLKPLNADMSVRADQSIMLMLSSVRLFSKLPQCPEKKLQNIFENNILKLAKNLITDY